MPLPPLVVTLSDGQKIAALKRMRTHYGEELAALEIELTELLTALAEADFLTQYLGEQPEVVELRKRKAEAEPKQRRREYLGKVIEHLDKSIPQQADVRVPPPSGAPAATAKAPGLKRF